MSKWDEIDVMWWDVVEIWDSIHEMYQDMKREKGRLGCDMGGTDMDGEETHDIDWETTNENEWMIWEMAFKWGEEKEDDDNIMLLFHVHKLVPNLS